MRGEDEMVGNRDLVTDKKGMPSVQSLCGGQGVRLMPLPPSLTTKLESQESKLCGSGGGSSGVFKSKFLSKFHSSE